MDMLKGTKPTPTEVLTHKYTLCIRKFTDTHYKVQTYSCNRDAFYGRYNMYMYIHTYTQTH